MVLQAQLYPSAGPQGYVHKEEYYKNDQYNHGATHKQDYYQKDSYYGSNPSIHTGPSPGFNSFSGSHIAGGYGGHHSSSGQYGIGQSNYPRHDYGTHGYGIHQGPHGSYGSHGSQGSFGSNGSHGSFGSHGSHGSFGSHVPVGPNRIETSSYGHQYQGSSGPYGQHSHNSWISKDLDD